MSSVLNHIRSYEYKPQERRQRRTVVFECDEELFHWLAEKTFQLKVKNRADLVRQILKQVKETNP